MNGVNLDRLAESIRVAGQSGTGLALLILIFVSGVIIVTLHRAPSSVRILAYSLLAIGLGGFCWLVHLAVQLPPGPVRPG